MRKKIIAILTALMFAFVFTLSMTVSAEDTVSLTLICKKDDTVLTGMNWRLYYIGHRSENTYTFEGDFADYAIDIDATSIDSMSSAATTLENYAIIDQIPCINAGHIDMQGYLVFPYLKSGLYMVSGDIFNIEEVFYQPSPALIEIDTDTEDNNIELIVYPKITYALLSEINLNNIVRKIWNDDKIEHPSIEVEIFRNAELFKTVTLNDENNWQYEWKDTEAAEWRVKEKIVPPDYTVVYKSDNGKFAIENTYNGIEEVTTESPTTTVITTTVTTEPKLPQTGQLWWPVIAMSGIGAVMIVIGIKMRIKDEK